MKDQPWDLNQTWPVGWKWCLFTNAPTNFGALPQIWGAKIKILTTFRHFCTRHRIYMYPERNVASTNKNASVNLQCVHEKFPTFRYL